MKLNYLFFALLFALSACAPILPEDFKDENKLFSYAMKLYEKEDHREAIKFFQEIERNYPLSQYLARSIYYRSLSALEAGEEIEAIDGFNSFLRLYPEHKLTANARFYLAKAYEEQIPSTIDRDQTNTQKALNTYKQYLALHPAGTKKKLVKERITKLEKQLAQRELYIALFYYRQKKYAAAVARLEGLQKKFPAVDLAGEGNYYLGISYFKQKKYEQAKSPLEKIVSAKKREYLPEAKKLLKIIDNKKGVEQ